jgi:hypothetical protein
MCEGFDEPNQLVRIFLGPDEEIMKTCRALVDPLREIVLTAYAGALKRYILVLQETIKHADISKDPELLQLTLFFAMSGVPSMQAWAEPQIPPGRRDVFFYELEALARDLACKNVDVATYLREMYSVVMIGKREGPIRLPHPRHLDEWRREFKDGDLPDATLVDGAAVDAALALRADADEDFNRAPGRIGLCMPPKRKRAKKKNKCKSTSKPIPPRLPSPAPGEGEDAE